MTDAEHKQLSEDLALVLGQTQGKYWKLTPPLKFSPAQRSQQQGRRSCDRHQ